MEDNGQNHAGGKKASALCFSLNLSFSYSLPLTGNPQPLVRGAFQCCYDTKDHKYTLTPEKRVCVCVCVEEEITH